MTHVESLAQTLYSGAPTLAIRISDSKANKLQEGPLPLATPEDHTTFWTFIAAWGGNWMWRDMDNSDTLKDDMQWVTDRMIVGTLIWTTNGSYDRKQAANLSGVGWIIFCKATGR
jgi:hypothetical protein